MRGLASDEPENLSEITLRLSDAGLHSSDEELCMSGIDLDVSIFGKGAVFFWWLSATSLNISLNVGIIFELGL